MGKIIYIGILFLSFSIKAQNKVIEIKKTDTIKTTFDLRTCVTNMQDEDGFVSLSKTQWEEILKQIEK